MLYLYDYIIVLCSLNKTMQYRKDKYGEELSILGYGCMRFSRKGGAIDLDKTEQELLAAYEAGVNYFDTAYIYPGSEVRWARFSRATEYATRYASPPSCRSTLCGT